MFLKLCGLKYGRSAAVKASRKMVRIRAALLQCARSSPTAEAKLPLRLQLPADLGTRWKYSIYIIDSENHNPQATFRAARTSGRSQAEAIAAAQAVGFAPTLSGTGSIPELTLERYAVVLYVLEPASAR